MGDEYWVLDIGVGLGYSNAGFSDDSDDAMWCSMGAWRTESEIKQVVDALRKLMGVAK